jgi:hypothetical protein
MQHLDSHRRGEDVAYEVPDEDPVHRDRQLNHSDRRRSLKRRYLHLHVAGRSQVLSGSGGTSADSKRKFASDRAASHAPSPAMTSAPRYFRILSFHTTMTQLLGGADQRWLESGAGSSGPVEPRRFADTFGMRSRRLFAR